MLFLFMGSCPNGAFAPWKSWLFMMMMLPTDDSWGRVLVQVLDSKDTRL